MFPYHVAVAARTSRGHTGYSFSFEDGSAIQMLIEGQQEEHLPAVLEEVLKHTGLERQVVILTRSKIFLGKAKDISAVFKNLALMSPYDHASEEEYRVAHEKIDDIEFPPAPQIEIAADASVSPTRAVWAWVRRRSTGNLEFGFGISPVADSNAAEMLAIIHAGVQGKPSRPIKIYSDSRNAIQAITHALETDGQTPEVLKTRGKRNLPLTMQRLAERYAKGLVEMEWVKGHADHGLNILADQIATYARRRLRTESKHEVIREEITQFLKEFERNGTVQFS